MNNNALIIAGILIGLIVVGLLVTGFVWMLLDGLQKARRGRR